MTEARFLQIHSLSGYSAVLLNRDDAGLAKRLPYGGTIRTRISSQCLKRRWRTDASVHSLHGIDGATAAIRSRDTVTRRVIAPLAEGPYHPDAIGAIETAFQTAIYGAKSAMLSNRQPLLLGEPEIAHLTTEARVIAEAHGNDPGAARVAANAWAANTHANIRAMRESCALPGGLAAALFGRMVTSDLEANIDAAVHVAHAFTVHAEESESDYFSVVDDLQRPDPGAGYLGETELTAGLFYGYVVVDRPGLLENLGGDAEMAGEVARGLVWLIATVSPGAKLGPTAPYGYASWMLVEAGDRQPRSLAEAFREPCRASVDEAEQAVHAHLDKLDKTYETGKVRRVMNLHGSDPEWESRQCSLPTLAEWAGASVREGTA